MKVRALVLALVLLSPLPAMAGPITAGVWSEIPTGDPTLATTGTFYWDGVSWDCPECGVANQINLRSRSGMEYLHDGTGKPVGFSFDDQSIVTTLIAQLTAWQYGILSRRADGAFMYDSGTGRVSNSLDNGEQYVLFRMMVGDAIRYFMGIEDIPLSEGGDQDYNDYVVTFDTPTNPAPVPEPSTLLLLGSSLAFAGIRKARAARKAKAQVA